MSREMYQVLDQAGRSMGYFKAATKGQAKKVVIDGLTVSKLSGEQIYAVHQAGYGVTSVVDGKIEANPVVEGQPELPLTGDATQAP